MISVRMRLAVAWSSRRCAYAGRRCRSRPRPSKPPTRACGRPPSVTASATRISSVAGASATQISMASKWQRTSIAFLWWTGMSRWAPIAALFLTDGRIETPSDGRAHGRAELRVQERRDVLELALLADDPALAIRLDRRRPAPPCADHELGREATRPASISSEMSSEYSPAYGFFRTAATATRRRGLSSARPPSSWISSVNVTHLRTSTANAAPLD